MQLRNAIHAPGYQGYQLKKISRKEFTLRRVLLAKRNTPQCWYFCSWKAPKLEHNHQGSHQPSAVSQELIADS